MEILIELVKLIIPAAVVLYAMYLTIRAFVHKEIEQAQTQAHTQVQLKEAEQALKQQELALKNREQILPIRLQAYERMVLFLERISPAQIIPRLNNPEFSVGLFQHVLIQEIRNEFSHNLSQQMYMSPEAWMMIKRGMEETILLINNSTLELDEDAPGLQLAKRILENQRDHNINPTQDALDFLKEEVRQLF